MHTHIRYTHTYTLTETHTYGKTHAHAYVYFTHSKQYTHIGLSLIKYSDACSLIKVAF